MTAITTAQFIARAKSYHGSRFDYSKTKYVNRRTKVAIKCKKHGIFWMRPDDHVRGCGCQTCAAPFSTSALETEWLDSKRIAKTNRQKRLVVKGKVYTVDAFVPRSKTVYEFYGDVWHGNPDVYKPSACNPCSGIEFGTLYERTMKREKVLKKAGYKVVSIWENDWKETQ